MTKQRSSPDFTNNTIVPSPQRGDNMKYKSVFSASKTDILIEAINPYEVLGALRNEIRSAWPNISPTPHDELDVRGTEQIVANVARSDNIVKSLILPESDNCQELHDLIIKQHKPFFWCPEHLLKTNWLQSGFVPVMQYHGTFKSNVLLGEDITRLNVTAPTLSDTVLREKWTLGHPDSMFYILLNKPEQRENMLKTAYIQSILTLQTKFFDSTDKEHRQITIII